MTGSGDSRQPRDQGVTLPELLVAMFATSIILIGVGTVFTGSLRSLTVVNAKAQLTSDAQLAMQVMLPTLRAANGIPNPTSGQPGAIVITGDATSLSFRADLKPPVGNNWAATQLGWSSTYKGTLDATGLWPYRVDLYLSTSGCGAGGTQPGVIQALRPTVFNNSTGAASTPAAPTLRCILRTRSLTGLGFRYFGTGTSSGGSATSGCVIPDTATPARWPAPSTVTPSTSPGSVKSIEVSVIARDTSGRQVSLLNQICLTN
jgi:hypothetical protein